MDSPIFWVVVGLVLLFVVLTITVIRFWPVIRYGTCWGGFVGAVDDVILDVEIYGKSETEIIMSDCVGSLTFIDGSDGYRINQEGGKIIRCPKASTLVVGMPYKHDFDFTINPVDLAVELWDEIKDEISDTRGVKPFCKSMEKRLSYYPDPILGPGEGESKTICISMENAPDTYVLKIDEGKCLV